VDLSTDSIRLTVPASPAAVRIARAGAAGLATRAGFTYHEVEQVRRAVGEATALLAGDADGKGDPNGDGDGDLGDSGDRGALTLTFEVEPDGMRIDLRVVEATGGPGAGLPPPLADGRSAVPEVSAAVLDATVDGWRVVDRGRSLVLDKRLSFAEDDEIDG
jgi:hypothetical protein